MNSDKIVGYIDLTGDEVEVEVYPSPINQIIRWFNCQDEYTKEQVLKGKFKKQVQVQVQQQELPVAILIPEELKVEEPKKVEEVEDSDSNLDWAGAARETKKRCRETQEKLTKAKRARLELSPRFEVESDQEEELPPWDIGDGHTLFDDYLRRLGRGYRANSYY